MGDITDMMLDGTLDCETGEYIGDSNKEVFGEEVPGFPVSYEKDSEYNPNNYQKKQLKRPNCTTQDGIPIFRSGKINCPECNKLIKKIGLPQHMKDKHPA